MSRHQNAGQHHDMKGRLKMWKSSNILRRTIVTHQTLIHEEINGRLKSGNAGYHSTEL
jgi:hypothetical protein